MIHNLRNRRSFKKYNSKIWTKKIRLLFISVMIVIIIIPPNKQYNLKDYEKFAKEHNIEYEIINCPECGTEIADTLQFCFKCNATLFNASEETINILKKINKTLEPSPIEHVIRVSKKIILYSIMTYIVYFMLKKLLIEY